MIAGYTEVQVYRSRFIIEILVLIETTHPSIAYLSLSLSPIHSLAVQRSVSSEALWNDTRPRTWLQLEKPQYP